MTGSRTCSSVHPSPEPSRDPTCPFFSHLSRPRNRSQRQARNLARRLRCSTGLAARIRQIPARPAAVNRSGPPGRARHSYRFIETKFLKMEMSILPETASLYPAQPGECLWSQFSFKSSAGTAPVKLHILIDHRLQTESRCKRLMRVPGVLFSKRVVFRQL
jgi:hypothetical protein